MPTSGWGGWASIFAATLLLSGILTLAPTLEWSAHSGLIRRRHNFVVQLPGVEHSNYGGGGSSSGSVAAARHEAPPTSAVTAGWGAPPASRDLVCAPLSEEALRDIAELEALTNDPDAFDEHLRDRDRVLSMHKRLAYRDAINRVEQHRIRNMRLPPEAVERDAAGNTASPCKRFVISFSTVPKRIGRLGNLIRTLKAQKYQPDAILIGVPPFAPRLKQRYVVPKELLEDDLVKIVHLPMDYGPLSKIVGGLLHETDPDTCILTVDDDAEPYDEIMRTMITWSTLFPGVAMSTNGWNKTCITDRMPFVCPEGLDTYIYVRQSYDNMCRNESIWLYGERDCFSPVQHLVRAADVLMGVSLVLYRRGMFADDFLDLPRFMVRNKVRTMIKEIDEGLKDAEAAEAERWRDVRQAGVELLESSHLKTIPNEDLWERSSPPEEMFLVDDVYISAYLAKKGIPRLVVPHANLTGLDIPKVAEKHRNTKVLVQTEASQGQPQLGVVDALHGVARFNLANYFAARYLAHMGWW